MSDISKASHQWMRSLRNYPDYPKKVEKKIPHNKLSQLADTSCDTTLSTHPSMINATQLTSSKSSYETEKTPSLKTIPETMNYEEFLNFINNRIRELNIPNRTKCKAPTPTFSKRAARSKPSSLQSTQPNSLDEK